MSRREHSLEYLRYLQSPEWAAFRAASIVRVGNRCERCDASGEKVVLQVHHLNYIRLGCELPEDVKVVCVSCHAKEDAERERRAKRDSYNRRLDAWATKVWGENWEYSVDPGEAEERFDDWLDRQGE